MNSRWMANIGLCAAVGVLVASLSILVFQSGKFDTGALPSLAPAQIQPGSMGAPAAHSTPAADSNSAHSDSVSSSF
jgi:hypothetical protein